MKTILHCDANNFFASVEILLNPELKGKPIAVSGDPEKRHGIVLAKSEEAKKYDVKTAEPIWKAKRKCPNIIFVKPHYDAYVEISQKLFKIYCEYTDRVEPFGIDECWLDCTESTNLFGNGEQIAETLRNRIKKEIGITISVGVSFTKTFAKLGSDYKKPDAVTIIDKANYQNIVWNLPASDLLMVGKHTTEGLKKLNIKTIGDLANTKCELLEKNFGVNGKKLWQFANGIEAEEVRLAEEKPIPESIGNSTTTPFDITNESEAFAVITSLSEMVATRLRKNNLVANGIGLGIKYNSLNSVNKTNTINYSTCSAKEIADEAIKLLHILHDFTNDLPIRQLGVYTYKLTNENIRQISMFDAPHEKQENLEKSIDDIRKKYGQTILHKGIVDKHKTLCDGLVDKEFKPFKK